MESLIWHLRTLDSFSFAWPVLLSLVLCFAIAQTDMPLLLGAWFAKHALGRGDTFRAAPVGARPTGLVVIPSLLRNREDLSAITTTVESCVTNGYPSELVIIAAVDGLTEQPELVAELERWVRALSLSPHVFVYVAGTRTRLGKMMAVEAGVERMRELVSVGWHERFPDVYFSIDGDGTLSEHALERLVAKLTRPHPITGRPRRVVSGKICIRPDLFWQGWRKLFTLEGQIYLQVAREFLVSNVARHNWKLTPMIGIPGALYCTWGEIIQQAPRFMGYMQGLRFVDWLKWWAGIAPPSFAGSSARSLPEALTGASDDTCIAFIASIAQWKNGALSFEAPRTPLHALGRLVMGYFFERSHDYEPEARVFTYTPDTLKGLWRQRVRWNSSRFECAGRFWRAFWFHWEIGLPVSSHLWLVLQTVIEVTTYYVLLPYYCLGSGHAMVGYVVGYCGQTLAHTIYTLLALMLERDWRRHLCLIVALPLASLYCTSINFFGCVYGVTNDLLLFGNWTNFAPEWTLKKSRCERVALLFRARRFLALALRAVTHGDVPFGAFWFGWNETPWTPSGFEGWTTGKRPGALQIKPQLSIVPPARVAPATREPVAARASGTFRRADAASVAIGSGAGDARPRDARQA